MTETCISNYQWLQVYNQLFTFLIFFAILTCHRSFVSDLLAGDQISLSDREQKSNLTEPPFRLVEILADMLTSALEFESCPAGQESIHAENKIFNPGVYPICHHNLRKDERADRDRTQDS